MPSARATAAPRRQPRVSPPRARRAARRRPRRRIRWDRVGRLTLLVVLAIVAGLYVQQALAYFSVRSQADRQQAIVKQLSRENAALRKEQASLNDPATILRDARELGMVMVGERPYVIPGSAGN